MDFLKQMMNKESFRSNNQQIIYIRHRKDGRWDVEEFCATKGFKGRYIPKTVKKNVKIIDDYSDYIFPAGFDGVAIIEGVHALDGHTFGFNGEQIRKAVGKDCAFSVKYLTDNNSTEQALIFVLMDKCSCYSLEALTGALCGAQRVSYLACW